jgi:hypothetical protein
LTHQQIQEQETGQEIPNGTSFDARRPKPALEPARLPFWDATPCQMPIVPRNAFEVVVRSVRA